VTGFDAERYLRAAGEQWARESGTGWPPCNPVLAATAAALVAVDAITIANARAVIGEYDPALIQGPGHQDPAGEETGRSVARLQPAAGIRTWIETLPAQDPAVRHLWERVATLNDFHDPHLALEATIAALVAAGAMAVEAPVIDDAWAVLAVLRPEGAGPVAQARTLAGPWASLLARWGQTGGPACTIAVGAVTPPFDGITAAVTALESRDEHFVITVELVPGACTGLPYSGWPDQQHLTWWAVDNLGHYYLGEQGSWNPGDDRAWGAIGFWPALDERATSVDLMPTAATARAVIRVPCARGDARSG
jgi:hypothetical protein